MLSKRTAGRTAGDVPFESKRVISEVMMNSSANWTLRYSAICSEKEGDQDHWVWLLVVFA